MEDFSIMRFRTALSLAAFFLPCSAVWSTPLNAQSPVKTGVAGETQTISGKIAPVGDAEFTLEVAQSEKQNKVQFWVDGTTKEDGKLTVGAQATVDYRSEGGKNIATHVLVMPTSGI
jgi:hypothetical protein